jgi:hypothetical protein
VSTDYQQRFRNFVALGTLALTGQFVFLHDTNDKNDSVFINL